MDTSPRQSGPGEQRRLEDLLTDHMPQLRAFVRLRLGHELRRREDSLDLAQSICREMLEDADRFGEGDEVKFRTWLYTAARRKLANRVAFHRAERRDVRRELVPLQRSDEDDDELLQCYRNSFTPSRHARAREQLAQVESALDQLPPAARELILMARVLGMPRKEIAERTGQSYGAVRTALSRAQAKLAALLEDADA